MQTRSSSRLRFDESFSEASDRFKDLLRAFPHHGFSELHQLDKFYNALNSKDQDSIYSIAGVVAKVSTNTSTFGISPDVAELKDMAKALLLDKKSQNQALVTMKAVEESCVTCGGAHSYRNCPATDGNVYRDNIQEYVSKASAVNYNQGNTSYRPSMMPNQIRPPGFPPATMDTVHPINNGSTENVQPQVVQSKSPILTSEPVNSLIIEPVTSPISASTPNLRPLIPYPSRIQDQKLRDKANDQCEKFFQIIKDLNFNISFADALILMPKFGPSIKSLLTNKDKLCELARTPLNEHCSTVILKKLPEKVGDPGKFLIPCDFPGKAECLALADLGVSINLMPLSMYNKLSLPDLTLTCMTLELADRSISRPVGVAGDVYVKVGSFHFLADFIVVDFDADPRVPLILGRSFLKTRRALIDVDMTAKRIDVIDMACEESSQEVLVDAFLAIEDDPTSPKVDQSYLDPEGDILLLESFLNDDLSLPPPNQGNYLPKVHKELKICEAKYEKSSIDEPPEVELKDLPPHLEYAFLEDQEKTTFTCPYGTFAYRHMPIGLCNAPGTFQRCMMAIFHDKIEKTMEVFMDDFSVFGNSFQSCLSYLERMFKRCEDTKLCLNWEKSHFMVKEAFQTLKRKLTEAPILIAPDWDMPFEIMYDASDFAIGSVLGQHQDKHFRTIHYATYENSLIYKEKTKRLHDLKIKDRVLNIGDRVPLFNSRLKIFSGKHKSRWSGPFTISHVYSYGTVELSQPNGPNFKVNGHRLKHYFGEDVPKLVVPDL
nr:reverse transcriptase domain-containing protein [Tanacetum cinerariifolium]